MFMQSGIPGALHLTMIVIPAMGLCVWLAIALIHARYAARAAQREEPRLLDTCGVLVELHQLVEVVIEEYLLRPVDPEHVTLDASRRRMEHERYLRRLLYVSKLVTSARRADLR